MVLIILETMNKSFGDELLFDWAHEDVEITDNLDGWYTVEFVGEGMMRVKRFSLQT